MTAKQLPHALRVLRTLTNVKQCDLAVALGLRQAQLSKMERGTLWTPPETLEAAAAQLKIPNHVAHGLAYPDDRMTNAARNTFAQDLRRFLAEMCE